MNEVQNSLVSCGCESDSTRRVLTVRVEDVTKKNRSAYTLGASAIFDKLSAHYERDKDMVASRSME